MTQIPRFSSRTRSRRAASALLAPALVLLAANHVAAQVGTLTTIGGEVNDLSVHSSGDLLYCTSGREVGRITTGGVVTVVADSASGPFDKTLRGVVETPGGDISVIDIGGDIHVLTGGVAPATEVYSDLYMIQGVTDFIVDASGNYIIASDTPSTGFRGINWISPDGSRWAYYLVKHQPLALAADATNGDLVLADGAGSGSLRHIDAGDPARSTSPLDVTTGFGITESQLDGDMAVETDGSVWIVGGNTVWRHDRGSGITSVVETGLGLVRGVTIAASSGMVPSASGWSVYFTEGAGPTAIREIGNAGAPASVTAAGQGTVPNRGVQQHFFSGFNVFEMTTDNDGNLLVGGDSFGSNFRLARISLPTFNQSIIAAGIDGIDGRIEGISVDQDDVIHVVTKAGRIQRVVESPLSVTTVFSDPGNQIISAMDLVTSREGTFYVADRAGFDVGQVDRVDPNGTVTPILATEETRGIHSDPFTGELIVTEWVDTGFEGNIGLLDPDTGILTDLPQFEGMNYTNADAWGDGDVVQDVRGDMYTASEDDWSLYRYRPATQQKIRIGSSYLNHPTGLAIATSTVPSMTGWSLYVAEFNFLWEIPNVAAPAPNRFSDDAPPVGRMVGFLPGGVGRARAMVSDEANDRFLVSTSQGRVYLIQLNGQVNLVAGPMQGVSGDLVAMAKLPSGSVLVANRGGTIFELDTMLNVTTFFDNALGDLSDVRGMEVDGAGNVLVLDRDADSPAGRLYRFVGGRPELVAFTNRGLRMAIDPLTADVFVTQQGNVGEGGGEILRVDTFANPPTAGHHRADGFTLFDVGERDGGIAFDASGNLFVVTGREGTLTRVDRTTGVRTEIAGQYQDPSAVVVAPGQPGTAGAMGSSVFVLDDFTLYEIGIDDLPAGAPPLTQPGLAPPAELRVHGFIDAGTTTPITVESPAHAGQVYAIYFSFLGKVPGFPLQIVGDPDPRVLPNNYNFLWFKLNGAILPGTFGVLDGSGLSAPSTGFYLPNDPSLLGLDLFFDMVWLAYDLAEPNGVDRIGSTAQFFVGQ